MLIAKISTLLARRQDGSASKSRTPEKSSLALRVSRRLESHAFASTPEQIGILEGLRAATAVAVMVAAAVWLDRPLLSWAAFGAFWVCLADPGGPDGLRLRAMGGFAAAGTVVAWIASATAGASPLLAGAVLLVLVFLSSLSRTYGAAAAQSGVLVCVVAVVAVSFPGRPEAALGLAGAFLLGSVWALVLCIGIWRIHPHGPARKAVASVFARLGDMTSELLALDRRGTAEPATWNAFNADHRRSIRTAIERARAIVTDLETGCARYSLEIDLADRVFAGLIAVGHHLGERGKPLDERTERCLVHDLRRLLIEAKHQAARREPQRAALSMEAAALVGASAAAHTVIGRAIATAAEALGGLAEASRNGAGHAADRPESPRKAPAEIFRPIPAAVLRHAGRLSIAVVVSYTIATRLDLTFSYWATMATVVVSQPLATTTWPRSVERMVGSVAGGLWAAALIAVLPSKLALLAGIFPIAAATIAFRQVNYTVFVFFLTPLFVLVTELLNPGSGIASARAINNVIGSLVGVGASFLLWPDRDGTREALAEAVAANLAYAARVVATGEASSELSGLRRAAGVASGVAETARHRMILEGRKRRAHLTEMADLLEALRVLAGAATAEALTARTPDKARSDALGRISAALADAVRRPSPDAVAAVPAEEPRDDLGQAVRAVVAAASTYAHALHGPI